MKKPLARLIGEAVVVRTGDLAYRGILREVTEDTVSLMGATGWREIPMNRVVAIRPAEDEEPPVAVRPISS